MATVITTTAAAAAAASAKSSFQRIVCHTLSSDFRAATSIVSDTFPEMLEKNDVVVENHYLGINASDINFTNGKYLPGVQPPFNCGFEAVGKITRIGSGVKTLKIGDAVVTQGFGSFSEFQILSEKVCMKIPMVSNVALTLNVCGVTASIALDKVGQMSHGETVMVTAAAGATGQFAVQLAKLAGNHVIGTCSSAAKVDYLRSIGCDRIINYKEEEVSEVLKKEYPNGIDLVFESVGGQMFDSCVNNLAVGGRLVVIGAVSGYTDGTAWTSTSENKVSANPTTPLSFKLLQKSASIRGFFLNHFIRDMPSHMRKLTTLIQHKKLNAGVDPTSFIGLESVPDALDFMYNRSNIGKLVVQMFPKTTDNEDNTTSRL